MPLVSSSIDISVLQEFFPNVLQNYNGQSVVNMNYNQATPFYLEITTQPCDKFRFRYYSEPGSHGSITGKTANGRGKKIFPTVKLVNPDGIATRRHIIIKASLYTADDNPRPHVLSCLSKNNNERNQDGACYEELSQTLTAQFKNLGIFILKRDEIIAGLQQRKKQELNISRLTQDQEESIVEEFKSFNLNETKLRFEAFYNDDMTPVPCPAVFSDTIYNSKATATGDLKICRLSLFKGSILGEEDLIILCDKIKKDDVAIRFYETDHGSVVWETYANFNPSDVHYQVAIPFKTPKYEGCNKESEIQTFIQLCRKSDGKYGDPVPFVYKKDIYPNPKKRKISEDSGFYSFFELLSEFDPNKILLSESEDSSDLSLVASDNSSSFPSDFVLKDAVTASGSLLEEDTIIGEMGDQFSHFSLSDSAAGPSNSVKNFLECFSKGVHYLLKDKNILYYVPSSVTIQDTEENSILHLAIIAKQSLKFIEAIIKLIKEDLVNHKNFHQKTPMHLATQQGNSELLKLLLNNGGNVHHTDKKGNSCLHIAAMNDFSKCLETLLTFFPTQKEEFASKINAENDDGLTPLHISILNDSKDCLKILLNKADINEPEKKGGKSPLHLAVEKKSPFLENILSQPNINIYCTDYKGLTALELACEENDLIFEEVPVEVIHEKEHLLLYLKEKLKIKTDDSSVQNNSGLADQELQRTIESILNKSSEWKKLGSLINFSEGKLQNLLDLEENPAGCLIEKIMEEKQLDLKEIIKRAGLTSLVSNLTGW